MATYSTVASITALKALYAALITEMEYDSSAAALAIWEAEAAIALSLWGDAKIAEINLNASAAKSYSNGVGFAVTKAQADEAAGRAEGHLQDFADILLRGGVTMPSHDTSIELWDMRGVTHAY